LANHTYGKTHKKDREKEGSILQQLHYDNNFT